MNGLMTPSVRMHGGLLRIAFCLSVTRPKIISATVHLRVMKFSKNIEVDDPKVELEGHRPKVKVTRSKTLFQVSFDHLKGNLRGQGSHGSRSTVTWFKFKGRP